MGPGSGGSWLGGSVRDCQRKMRCGLDHFCAREAGVSKIGGASEKKLPYQRLELRPSRMWMKLAAPGVGA